MWSAPRTLSAVVLVLVGLACSPTGAPPAAPAKQPAGSAPAAGAPLPAAAAPAPASSPVPAREAIRVAYSTTALTFASSMVALDRGFYVQNGLDAELLQANPQVAQAGMMNGDITFSMSFGSQVRGGARGLPIRVVEQSVLSPLLYLVAQPELRTIPDLRGRVIAVSSMGGSNNQAVTLLLRKYGVDPQSAQYIAGGDSPRLLELLRQRQADAAMISPPFPYQARREGFNLLANSLEEIELAFTGLGTTLDVLAQRPQVVRRTIRAEIQALRHMHADRADTIRLFEERFAMDSEGAAQAYDLIIGAHSKDGSISRAGVENLMALDKEEGAIAEHVRFEDVVDLAPLLDVQRELGLAP